MFPHAAHEQQRRPPRAFRTGRWHSRVRGLPETLSELPVATLADEMETPGEGQVRALLTIAGNPALTTPDAGRLDGLLAELELVVCVDPYLNATTRHADVILPPPSVLEKSHYDLAFTALSVRNVANFSPPVFEREPGSPSEFEILVRLAAIAAGLGADADPDALADATHRRAGGRGGRRPGVARSTAATRTRSWPRSATARAEERLLDLLLRTGHRGDAFGARPDGLSLELLEAHPHGIDFGPLEPRLPDALATESGKVELAPPQLVDDLARLERALDVTAAGGMVLVGRRQLRTANSWTQNVQVLVRGKDSCVAQLHPDDAGRIGLADGATATIRSAAGSIDVPVEVTDVVMPGVVCIPYGWGHGLPGTRQAVAAGHAGRQREHPHRRLRRRPDLGERRAQRHPGHRRAGVAGRRRDYPARLVRYTAATARYPTRNWSTTSMIERVNVIGRGRVGSAVAARLLERGLALDESDPELVLLCVPDRAIGEAAAYVSPGPWVAHVSGATPLAALAPHTRRFSVHPLQTFTRPARRRSSSTAPGRAVDGRERRGARRRDLARRDARPAPVPARTTRTGPPTTPAPRSPPTTSSRSGRRRARCSRRRARRRRRSTR